MKFLEVLFLWAHYLLKLIPRYEYSGLEKQITIAFVVTWILNISIVAFLLYC
jgi:hypothetical protein